MNVSRLKIVFEISINAHYFVFQVVDFSLLLFCCEVKFCKSCVELLFRFLFSDYDVIIMLFPVRDSLWGPSGILHLNIEIFLLPENANVISLE